MEEMYKTFNLDSYISFGFKKLYELFIDRCRKEKITNKDLRIKFANEKIYIGSINVDVYIDKIIKIHGSPKYNAPSEINFFIVNGVNQKYENGACWFEMTYNPLRHNIVYVTWDIINPELDISFDNAISHETQHIIRSMYKKIETFAPEDVNKNRYYVSDQEIVATCYQIIKSSLNDITSFYQARIKDIKDKNDIKSIISKMELNKEPFIKLILNSKIKRFLDKALIKTGEALTEEQKNNYYEIARKGFEDLYNDVVNRFKRIGF